ncbi:MAG TPA: LacI family DNA-binding transcriptional regulator [Candidatus Scatomorpha intestinavium]|uniref:LacI family DNA-binding transcriptional regulator n=1 Tax=Candidatus Scatomorpha intestinavium TaxID=2840922 RepID=A0A9D0ZCK3_9FIRM|nr:LacI family DNA-binding transcriptional regulator [Candidatus Scatomorpha intestinavium]
MSEQRVTMKDVAKAAGVTTAAVSYAISGKRPISDETRKRVEAAIKELGYTPNMAARTLSSAGRSSKLIGVVVPQTEGGGRLMFQNQFYAEILGSIELCARQAGYHVLISATDANDSYLTLAAERNLDGIIVIGMYPDEFYQQMKRSRIPIVLIDSYCNDHYYHNVRIDDAYGSYLATKYVLERGHRDIAFFCGRIKDNGVMKKRLAGYRDALGEYSVEFRDALVFEGDIDYKDGIESANRLMDTQVNATAVVAAADILAIGAAKAFYERGVRVPDGISLMGFDDLEISQYLTPGLTTVRQQISLKGEKAVELLIRSINEPELTKQELILPVSLVERESVKRI